MAAAVTVEHDDADRQTVDRLAAGPLPSRAPSSPRSQLQGAPEMRRDAVECLHLAGSERPAALVALQTDQGEVAVSRREISAQTLFQPDLTVEFVEEQAGLEKIAAEHRAGGATPPKGNAEKARGAGSKAAHSVW
jgi:hypothetical protein